MSCDASETPPRTEMEAVMALRQELYLLRDGSEEERSKRTSAIAALGASLHRCDARRHFRGSESKVAQVAAGLLQVAADRAVASPWPGADATFWRGYAEAQFACLLYTSPSPRDQRGSRMPSSA